MRPGSGATGVAASSAVTLYTNKALNAATVPGALYVSQDGILVAGTVQVTGGGTALQFTPAAPFTAGALVQVFLDNTAGDTAGNALSPFQGQFTVAADQTGVAPTVVRTTPQGSSVPRNAVVEVEFSKPLDATTALRGTLLPCGVVRTTVGATPL